MEVEAHLVRMSSQVIVDVGESVGDALLHVYQVGKLVINLEVKSAASKSVYLLKTTIVVAEALVQTAVVPAVQVKFRSEHSLLEAEINNK